MTKHIATILELMKKEAKKRDAPVLSIKNALNTKLKVLIFVMLSSRTKDETTIKALNKLFSKFRNVNNLAKANIREIEKCIYGVGFYKTKARRIKEIAKRIAKKGFPKTRDEFLELPGVGIKTANIVANHLLGEKRIGVDTHVHRISNRLGWVSTKKPQETEKELYKVIPKKYWGMLNTVLVAYGQTVCRPRVPLCSICVVRKYCKRKGVVKWQ